MPLPDARVDRRHRLSEARMNEAIRAYEEAAKSSRSRVSIPTEPQLPSLVISEERMQVNRYRKLRQFVESRPVAPIAESCLNAIMKRVPIEVFAGLVPQRLVQPLLDEVVLDYKKSMKLNTVQHVLITPPLKALQNELIPPLPQEPIGMDFSTPWRTKFLLSRKHIMNKLHIVHPCMTKTLKICHSLLAGTKLFDGSNFRSTGSITVELFQNDLMNQCRKTEEKFMLSWFLKIVKLFSDSDQCKSTDKSESFYRSLSTLISIQLKELLIRTVVAYVQLFDLSCKEHLPLFEMQLTLDDIMDIYPNPEDFKEAILEPVKEAP
uniref:Uncharacterized protein n=1 Tax=Eptatretus burgeri TaxID=7764 RepID=A0A8C4QFR6_EPTBU